MFVYAIVWHAYLITLNLYNTLQKLTIIMKFINKYIYLTPGTYKQPKNKIKIKHS